MIKIILILFLISGIQFMSYGLVEIDTVKTKTLNVVSKKDIYKLDLNFCDSFSIEFIGLYPILKDLPTAMNDKTEYSG